MPACVHVVFRLCAREHGCVVAKPCFGVIRKYANKEQPQLQMCDALRN